MNDCSASLASSNASLHLHSRPTLETHFNASHSAFPIGCGYPKTSHIQLFPLSQNGFRSQYRAPCTTYQLPTMFIVLPSLGSEAALIVACAAQFQSRACQTPALPASLRESLLDWPPKNSLRRSTTRTSSGTEVRARRLEPPARRLRAQLFCHLQRRNIERRRHNHHLRH